MKLPKVIIQTGGKGTRVPELTGGLIPKGLSRVIDKPLIARQLEIFKESGFNDILITVNELWQLELFKQSVRIGEFPSLNYVYHTHKWNHPFEIFIDEDVSAYIGEDDFILSYGDLVFDVELINNLIKKNKENGTSVACKMHSTNPRWTLDDKYLNFKENEKGLIEEYSYAEKPNFTIHVPFLFQNKVLEIIKENIVGIRNIKLILNLIDKKMLSVIEPKVLLNMNTKDDLDKVVNILKS